MLAASWAKRASPLMVSQWGDWDCQAAYLSGEYAQTLNGYMDAISDYIEVISSIEFLTLLTKLLKYLPTLGSLPSSPIMA